MFLPFDRRKLSRLKRQRAQSLPTTSTSGVLTQSMVQRTRSGTQGMLPSDIPTLQSTVGNQTVQRMLAGGSGGSTVIQREEEDEPTDQFHLDDKDLETSEPQGFKLLDDTDAPEGTGGEFHLGDEDLGEDRNEGFSLVDDPDTSDTPKPEVEARSYDRQRKKIEQPKAKKSLKEKFQRFGRITKHLIKGHSVYSYGKLSIHALMHHDEKMISKAERVAKKDPRLARRLLNSVYGVTKQGLGDVSSIPKALRLALLAPVWFFRWQVAHQRWKSLAKRLGMIRPKETESGEEKVTEVEPTETPKTPWRPAQAEKKDIYGWLHATMLGVGMDTFKGKGMTDRQKLGQWHKWRMNELVDPEVIMGGHRHDGWKSRYVRRGQQRKDGTFGRIGKARQKFDWQYGLHSSKAPTGKFMGSHRWHMEKPTGERSTDIEMGKHRPVWSMSKPEGERSSFKLGSHRPDWGFNKPQGRKSGIKLGSHRPDWGFEYPSGDKSDLKLGGHRPDWGFEKPKGTQWGLRSGLKLGKMRPEWGKYKGHGIGRYLSGPKIGTTRPEWGFDQPDGPHSGMNMGMHRLPPLPNLPWQPGHARYLHLPGSAPVMGTRQSPPEPEQLQDTVDETQVEDSLDTPTTQDMIPQESSTPESTSSTPLKVDDIHVLQSGLTVKSALSGTVFTIPAGTRILIFSIHGDQVRVDGERTGGGFATVAEVEKAIGFD